MKAAGAFTGLPRELRHNIRSCTGFGGSYRNHCLPRLIRTILYSTVIWLADRSCHPACREFSRCPEWTFRCLHPIRSFQNASQQDTFIARLAWNAGPRIGGGRRHRLTVCRARAGRLRDGDNRQPCNHKGKRTDKQSLHNDLHGFSHIGHTSRGVANRNFIRSASAEI